MIGKYTSLGPGSAGWRGNRKNIGEQSELTGDLGRGKGGGAATLCPPQITSRIASLADFFSFFPQCGAWSQARSIQSIYVIDKPVYLALMN